MEVRKGRVSAEKRSWRDGIKVVEVEEIREIGRGLAEEEIVLNVWDRAMAGLKS